MNKNEPIRLQPAFKDYLWGGTKLKELYNKNTTLQKCAESWELSAHPDGESTVASGAFSGCAFSQYLKENPDASGKKGKDFDFFPMLIKFIDAKDNLSIQVHPDDSYARKNHNEYGKTEMWYILDCEEDACLYYGFNRKITKDEYRERIENNTLLEVLNSVAVKPGDVFFIEAGTVHAIGKGIVICEIQQNSNVTYRVYDYDRRDAQGNPRPLHIERAMEVSDLDTAKPHSNKESGLLAECRYFSVEKTVVKGQATLSVSDDSFKSVIVIEGKGELSGQGTALSLNKGDSIFIPAQNADFSVSGDCELIVSSL